MNILIAPALGVFGLIVAFIVFSLVMRYSDGTDPVSYTHLRAHET